MDNTYEYQAPPENHHYPGYGSSFPEAPYSAHILPPPAQWAPHPGPIQADPRWAPPSEYGGVQSPAGRGPYGGPPMALPFAFDPSIPPPPFGGPPPGHYPPVNTYSRAGPQPHYEDFRSVSDSGMNRHQDYRDTGSGFGGAMLPRAPGQDQANRRAGQLEDGAVSERRQDIMWIKRFLQNRVKVSDSPLNQQLRRTRHTPVPGLGDALYRAAQLVSALEKSCQTLRDTVEDEGQWTDSYRTALDLRTELQDQMKLLGDGGEFLKDLKLKASRVGKRRARRLRARNLLLQDYQQRQEDISQKEAAIDTWRMKKMHEVEERKKEQELKLAADLVLCEVRKKQADLKRMQDILRSLEKLRRLRKEAASRKGIVTEQECDEDFSARLEQLRSVMKRRTAVYSVEENALMVMLEGEQEEERRKEKERRAKKERDKQLQRKHRMDAMLFGDELPLGSVLQPFKEYYTQAQHSLHALIQIRSEWDVFLVGSDHPDGSLVPQSWIFPEPPSNQDWATALQPADSD